MSKLLSRSKHEEFESNSALQIGDQKERKEENTRKLEHLRNWFLQHCSQLQHCSPSWALFTAPTLFTILGTVHPVARSGFLRCALFAFVFVFFPFYPCNSFWFCFIFFLVISYTLSTYISLSLYKLSITSLLAIDGGRQFRRCFLLSPIFFSFSLPFSATKHSSEDDNSNDALIDLFLLKEEGCWLGFGGNSRFSVFNARIYGYLCSISLNLGLNLLSTPSLACI